MKAFEDILDRGTHDNEVTSIQRKYFVSIRGAIAVFTTLTENSKQITVLPSHKLFSIFRYSARTLVIMLTENRCIYANMSSRNYYYVANVAYQIFKNILLHKRQALPGHSTSALRLDHFELLARSDHIKTLIRSVF
jgi:hypothetical protein